MRRLLAALAMLAALSACVGTPQRPLGLSFLEVSKGADGSCTGKIVNGKDLSGLNLAKLKVCGAELEGLALESSNGSQQALAGVIANQDKALGSLDKATTALARIAEKYAGGAVVP